MIRTIIKIDEKLCNGCGLCVDGCHEGALQLINGKATMISELYCDGLGACLGDCPEGAIILEEREAEPYDEWATIERIAVKGEPTIVAHINHLLAHNEGDYANQAMEYIKKNNIIIDFSKLNTLANTAENETLLSSCPGTKTVEFDTNPIEHQNPDYVDGASQLKHWPIQLHLINPMANHFKRADVLIAADCVAFAMGNFHQEYLKGKSLAIACPKLDSNKELYIDKLSTLIDEAMINTITVMIMEVPCCGGLMKMIQSATLTALRKIQIKEIRVSLKGEVLSEAWV
jgi:NAD-dependent dihydropyrimidine dehydrogenase PreA subunit